RARALEPVGRPGRRPVRRGIRCHRPVARAVYATDPEAEASRAAHRAGGAREPAARDRGSAEPGADPDRPAVAGAPAHELRRARRDSAAHPRTIGEGPATPRQLTA